MKGRKEFTKNEANAICKLIEEKLKADSVKQKSIRQKIRTLGFYASDFGLRNGYTVDDFRRVVDVVNQVDSISFRLEKEQRIKYIDIKSYIKTAAALPNNKEMPLTPTAIMTLLQEIKY